MKKKLLRLALIFLLILSVIVGVTLIARKFSLQTTLDMEIKSDSKGNYIALKEYDERIYITHKNDITKKRVQLIKYIWKLEGFPDKKMPEKIETDVEDKRYENFNNLKRIDKLFISMNYGMNSIAYHFIPSQSNNRLIVYHQGHDGDFFLGESTIQFFLNRGYSVLAFAMPLLGMNNQPTVDVIPFGKISLLLAGNYLHDIFKFLESEKFSPVKFFLEPIAVSLNYIKREFNYKSIDMIGLSGGGWTTTLYSAVDPRISKSYPVAGTLPIYLRPIQPGDIGDYEQCIPELYRMVNYLELYILGSYGDGRKQLQVLNKYDSCCFAGVGYQTYEKEVKKIVSRLGKGEFAVYLDETHKEHIISEKALEVIINDLEGDRN